MGHCIRDYGDKGEVWEYDDGSVWYITPREYRGGGDGTHFYRNLQGWGIQSSIVKDLKELKCNCVRVNITDEDRTIWIEFGKFLKEAHPIHHTDKTGYDHGEQLVVPERCFHRVVAKGKTLDCYDQDLCPSEG